MATSPSFAEEISTPQRSRRRTWFEILLAYGLILAVEWTPRPQQRWMWMVAALGIVLITWRGFDGWKAMGFRRANLGRSLWVAGAALSLAFATILIASRSHTLVLPNGLLAFAGTYSAYAIWSGVQQFLLQGLFLLRFLRLIRKPALAALTASLFFAGAHMPNPFLVPLTFIWGFAASSLFLRYRNIYPLMIAHAILGITIAMTVPGPVDHNMRVGLGYLRFNHRARPHEHRLMRFHRPDFLRIEQRMTAGNDRVFRRSWHLVPAVSAARATRWYRPWRA